MNIIQNQDINKVTKKNPVKDLNKYTKNFTSTSFFILPCLGISLGMMPSNFLNCFLEDSDHNTGNENTIIMSFKINKAIKNNIAWISFLKNLTKKKEYIYSYISGNHENYEILCLVFNLEEYKEDLEKYKTGKYSEFSEKFKNFHKKTKFINGVEVLTTIWEVFNKSKNIKNQWERELDVILDDNAEVWPLKNNVRECL